MREVGNIIGNIGCLIMGGCVLAVFLLILWIVIPH